MRRLCRVFEGGLTDAMRPCLRFRVEDWRASRTGLETYPEWTARSDETTPPNLPSSLRRRISDIGQRAFRSSFALAEQRGARFVFCSRYGEMDRTMRILE